MENIDLKNIIEKWKSALVEDVIDYLPLENTTPTIKLSSVIDDKYVLYLYWRRLRFYLDAYYNIETKEIIIGNFGIDNIDRYSDAKYFHILDAKIKKETMDKLIKIYNKYAEPEYRYK